MIQYQLEFVIAHEHFKKKNYRDAIAGFKRAIATAESIGISTTDETFEMGYYNIALSFMELKEFENAVDFLKKAIQHNSKMEGAYVNLVACCFELATVSSLELAIMGLKICVKQFPARLENSLQNLEIAFLKLGLAYLTENGNKDLAKKSFLNAKELGSKQADELINTYC